MSTYLNVQAPAQPAFPRGALFIGRLFDTLQAYRKAHQAQRELHQRARDAVRVRALAAALEKSDPGMASDLRCAVDRHF